MTLEELENLKSLIESELNSAKKDIESKHLHIYSRGEFLQGFSLAALALIRLNEKISELKPPRY